MAKATAPSRLRAPHAGARGLHRARSLHARDHGERNPVQPRPPVDVDEIDPDCGLPYQDLPGTRRRRGKTSRSSITSGPPNLRTWIAFMPLR